MPKDVVVPDVAEWFQRHGFTALVFDTFGIGESEGLPRCDTNMHRRVEDFIDSITFLSSHPLVDPQRIVLWGLCFDGNIMLAVSALDTRVAAVLAIAPMIDVSGDSERHAAIRELGVADRAAQLDGEPPMYLPLVDEDGIMPLGQTSGLGFFTTMQGMQLPVENRATVQSYLRGLSWSIEHLLPRISPTPVFMLTPELDQVFAAERQTKAFEMLGEPKEQFLVEGKDHFNWMFGDVDAVFGRQLRFLKRFVAV
ncbi:hypothetical protein ACJQWK_06183 [Exserohilum turcicum]